MRKNETETSDFVVRVYDFLPGAIMYCNYIFRILFLKSCLNFSVTRSIKNVNGIYMYINTIP